MDALDLPPFKFEPWWATINANPTNLNIYCQLSDALEDTNHPYYKAIRWLWWYRRVPICHWPPIHWEAAPVGEYRFTEQSCLLPNGLFDNAPKFKRRRDGVITTGGRKYMLARTPAIAVRWFCQNFVAWKPQDRSLLERPTIPHICVSGSSGFCENCRLDQHG